jgi:hypothetical protein
LLAGVVAAGAVRAVDVAAIVLIGFLVICSPSRRSSASRQGELGTSADRVHRTYLDSGAEE